MPAHSRSNAKWTASQPGITSCSGPMTAASSRPPATWWPQFRLRSEQTLDGARAGGRVRLVAGRSLTDKARSALEEGPSPVFRRPPPPSLGSSYTLAGKIVGRACGVDGVAPGTYCEPTVSSVGSQDTTGPMNRNELEELGCLGFSSDLVLQTFCHTSAYPKAVDIDTQRTLPRFMTDRGGIASGPGTGSSTAGSTGCCCPTRSAPGATPTPGSPWASRSPPARDSWPSPPRWGRCPSRCPNRCGSASAAPSDPASRSGTWSRPSRTRPDGRAISRWAAGGRAGGGERKNVFAGRIIEIEGLEDLTVEQAFELSDSTAERSAAGCTISLSEDSVAAYLRSNIVMLRSLIDAGYEDARSLERRAQAMERWLADPSLLRADADANYAAVVDIEASAITEPLVACPNDPDDVRLLSEVAGRPVDEVFIGSCMTNIGHFRAAGQVLASLPGPVSTRLWIAPPTRMDEAQLRAEGYYGTFGAAGARTELPGCSLCMGNQARVQEGSTVFSTSTRNFPNRMGRDAECSSVRRNWPRWSPFPGRFPLWMSTSAGSGRSTPCDLTSTGTSSSTRPRPR